MLLTPFALYLPQVVTLVPSSPLIPSLHIISEICLLLTSLSSLSFSSVYSTTQSRLTLIWGQVLLYFDLSSGLKHPITFLACAFKFQTLISLSNHNLSS